MTDDTKRSLYSLADELHARVTCDGEQLDVGAERLISALLDSLAPLTPDAAMFATRADIEALRRERDELAERHRRRVNELRAITADRDRVQAQLDALRAEATAQREGWHARVDRALAVLMGHEKEP